MFNVVLTEGEICRMLGKGETMTIRVGQWEIEFGVRKVRPLVGGNLDVQAELAAAYDKMGKPVRRRKRAARA